MIKKCLFLLHVLLIPSVLYCSNQATPVAHPRVAIKTVNDVGCRFYSINQLSENPENPGFLCGMFTPCGSSSKSMVATIADIFVKKTYTCSHLKCAFWQTQDAIKENSVYECAGAHALVAFLTPMKLLKIAYIGDLRLLVIRDGKILFLNPIYTKTVKTNPADIHDRSAAFSCIGNTCLKGVAQKAYPDMYEMQLKNGDTVLILSEEFGALVSEKTLEKKEIANIFCDKKICLQEKLDSFVEHAVSAKCKGSLKIIAYLV